MKYQAADAQYRLRTVHENATSLEDDSKLRPGDAKGGNSSYICVVNTNRSDKILFYA